jgi:hypothetical protein
MRRIQEDIRSNAENREENPVEKHDRDTNVGSRPPWIGEGRAIGGSQLTPVEGYETHTEAMSDAKQLVDLDIVRSDPADPRKVGECCEEISGKEV